MNTSTVLEAHIREKMMNGASDELGTDQDLLAAGIIDSLGILQLVTFIEDKFSIEVPDEDVTIENFHSIKSMSDYIAAKV